MKTAPGSRSALMTVGLGMVAGATDFAALHDGAASAAEPSLLPSEAKSLEELAARLSRTPRRRDFKTGGPRVGGQHAVTPKAHPAAKGGSGPAPQDRQP